MPLIKELSTDTRLLLFITTNIFKLENHNLIIESEYTMKHIYIFIKFCN